MLTDIKRKTIVTELSHSDRLTMYINPSKIYVDPGIEVHSNDLFSETMVLKFHMQHEKAAGLENNKFRLVWNQKWLLLKIGIPIKSTFSPEPLDTIG